MNRICDEYVVFVSHDVRKNVSSYFFHLKVITLREIEIKSLNSTFRLGFTTEVMHSKNVDM